MKSLRQLFAAALIFNCLAAGLARAQAVIYAPPVPASVEAQTITSATEVFQGFTAFRAQSIPQSMLADAQAVAIIPNVVKGGFVVAGRFGRGVLIVRDPAGWRAPSFITFAGGSVGWQIGLQSTDVVLVFKNRKGVEAMLNGSEFTLGADAAIAAGPVGRQATAGTDVKLNAEIYSYSRSRGLFAGVALDGSVLKIDQAANAAYYVGGAVPAPAVELVTIVSRDATVIAPTSLEVKDGAAVPAAAAVVPGPAVVPAGAAPVAEPPVAQVPVAPSTVAPQPASGAQLPPLIQTQQLAQTGVPGQPVVAQPVPGQPNVTYQPIQAGPIAGQPGVAYPNVPGQPIASAVQPLAAGGLVPLTGHVSGSPDQLRQALVEAAPHLDSLVDDTWRKYLALPPQVFSGQQPASNAELKTALARYDQIAADPQYRALADRLEFRKVHELLRHYSAASAGSLELPPPPPPVQ